VAWLGVLILPWAVPAGGKSAALFGLLLLASALPRSNTFSFDGMR
jgi:hypothetical protein